MVEWFQYYWPSVETTYIYIIFIYLFDEKSVGLSEISQEEGLNKYCVKSKTVQ